MNESQTENTVSTPDTVVSQEAVGPGQALAAAREARGVSVDDVAMRLKFAPRQIEALEADQYDQLPGIAIVRGMVRNYARLLEIDAAPLVAELEQNLRTGPSTVRPVDMHIPIKEGRKEGRMFLVLSLIVVIAVGVFALDWYVRDYRMVKPTQLNPDEAVEPVETDAKAVPIAEREVASTKLAASAPVMPVAHMSDATDVAPVIEAPAPEQSEPVTEAAPIVTASNETESQAAAQSLSAAADKALQMRFSAEVWVEVKDAKDRLLVARLAPAGSEISLNGEAPLSLVLGNADAVELIYQGEPIDLKASSRSGVARLTLE